MTPVAITGTATAALRTWLRTAVDRRLAPAIAVAVVDRRGVVFLDAAGTRDAAANAPITPDAIFRIASMTKPVTSLAAMMLVADGALDLDVPAATYIPELANLRVLTRFDERDTTWDSRPPVRPVTLRHLLTHTSGMAYPFLDSRLARMESRGTARLDMPLLHDPGERFTYSPATAIVGSIVAAVAGRSLDDVCRLRIFEPLGMTDTGYAVAAEHHHRVVTMQTCEAGRFVERANAPVIESRGRGDDGLLSTAEDYGTFMQLFLNDGVAGGVRVADPATIRTMMTNQIGPLRIGLQPAAPGMIDTPFPVGGDKDAFGFGFQIETAPQTAGDGAGAGARRRPGSCSWSGIFNTYFWIDPGAQIAAAVLMQFLPAHHAGALEVLNGVERLVYDARVAASA